MNKFVITYPDGSVQEEIVQECSTVESYINRKFGSAYTDDCGVKVTMEDLDEEDKAFENQIITSVTPEKLAKLKSYVMKVETGKVGAELADPK